MKPYYQDDYATIYCGDCKDIIPQLTRVDMVLTDPPYGIKYRSNHNSSHRKNSFAKWVRYENFPGIIGDEKPLDPEHLFICDKIVIFGGNYCADKLPPSRCWIVWNKRDGITPNNQADCELAWTNFDKPSRIYNHLWSGMLRAGSENISKSEKLHPHQKPLALCQFIINYSDLPRTIMRDGMLKRSTILDPYMGSGSVCRAAKDLGYKSIGIEIEEAYCEKAAIRMQQEVLNFGGKYGL